MEAILSIVSVFSILLFIGVLGYVYLAPRIVLRQSTIHFHKRFFLSRVFLALLPLPLVFVLARWFQLPEYAWVPMYGVITSVLVLGSLRMLHDIDITSNAIVIDRHAVDASESQEEPATLRDIHHRFFIDTIELLGKHVWYQPVILVITERRNPHRGVYRLWGYTDADLVALRASLKSTFPSAYVG